MLQLVLGRAGFGKTTYLYEKAVALAKAGEEGTILLVPEQLSFQTERAMIHLAGPRLAAKIQVLTFSRLAEEVFRSYGGITERRIDDSGKALLMALAILDCADHLTLYAQAAKSDRLTAFMLKAIEEFKVAGISAQALMTIGTTLTGGVKEKVREIALIYSAFEALLAGSYVEPTDLLTRAASLLRGHDFFANKTLLIDGFEGFNRQKCDLIALALSGCKAVYCALACPSTHQKDITSIFAPIEETCRKVKALARELGVAVAAPVVLTQPLRFARKPMEQLEAVLAGFLPEGTPQDCIHIYQAPDSYKELEYLAATIRNLVSEGYRYGDIAVVFRNGKKYNSLLEGVFRRFEIPAFVARPRAVDTAPLARLVLTAFRIGEFGFRTEDVLRFIKTGLCAINGQQISELENYAYMWRLNGNAWKSVFTQSPNGFGATADAAQCAPLEHSRKRIILPLQQFILNTSTATGEGISQAIFNLLEALGCEANVLANAKKLQDMGALEQAQEQLRFWKELMEILDKFARLLGTRRISRGQYGSLLQQVLAKERIMDIPLRLDSVLVGTAEQMKQSARVVFLLGAVQGEFPLIPENKGIFTQEERRILVSHQCALDFNEDEALLLERYYAYAAASSATEQLYISYPASDGKSDCAPSTLVTKTAKAFSLPVIHNLPREYFANCQEAVFSTAASVYLENTSEAAAFRQAAAALPAYAGRLAAIERAAHKAPYRLQDKALSAKMFENKTYSPSQIDTYHRCRFQYFCKYGLGATQRKPAQVDVLEYGSLLHYIFEKFLQVENFCSMDEEEIRLFAQTLIAQYAAENMGGTAILPPRDQYRLRRMADTAVLLMQRLAEELRESDFVPAHLELRLQEDGVVPPLKISLPEGKQAIVGGIIDRVDLYNGQQGTWVRVVDYKTGTKKFKLTDVLNGLSLQMLIYLNALKEQGMLPAGALYMPSAYPSFSMEKNESEEKQQQALQKQKDEKLCMNGLVISDAAVIQAMEHGARGRFIPVAMDDKGNIKKPESALSQLELTRIFQYVRGLIGRMAMELLEGNVGAVPLMVNTNSCDLCDYSAVCGVRQKETETVTMKKEDVLQCMQERSEQLASMD